MVTCSGTCKTDKAGHDFQGIDHRMHLYTTFIFTIDRVAALCLLIDHQTK